MNYDRPNYEVTSSIVCEDVRIEGNGKEILIGVYNETIIVGAMPYAFPKLCFRFTARVKKPDLLVCAYKLIDPHGNALVDYPVVPVSPYLVGEATIFGFVASVVFNAEGEYVASFGIGEPPIPTMRFTVRKPTTAEEVAKVGG